MNTKCALISDYLFSKAPSPRNNWLCSTLIILPRADYRSAAVISCAYPFKCWHRIFQCGPKKNSVRIYAFWISLTLHF